MWQSQGVSQDPLCITCIINAHITQGWLMRNTPNPPGVYLAALATVAGPVLIGNYAATALALLAGWRSQRARARADRQEEVRADVQY